MPKISRRKQSKPQHICGDDDSKEADVSNGPVGKDTVEDDNANIVVTEDNDHKPKNESDNEKDADDDVIPLQMEADDDDEENNLRIDEKDDRHDFDEDSNQSHELSSSTGQTERDQFSTPTTNDRVCDFCGVIKKSPSDLARHLLKHTGEHPFQCDLCDKAFKSKRSLQHHQHGVHGISLAVSMVAIDASIPVNRKRKSDEAVGCQSSPENESKKIKSEVQDLYNYPSMVYSGEHQPSVYISETSCSSTGSLKYSPTPVKLSPEEGNNRTCQVCGKTCSKPSDLKRHMMSHTGERPFQCNICGKAFRAKNSMFYHQKSSHGLNIELSPGLQERFMKLKKQSRLAIPQQLNSISPGFVNEDSREIQNNDPQMASSLLLQKLGQKVRCANNSVLYSYDINSHQEGEVELDENTGLFKQSGSIFNKPLVTPDLIKPEPLKLTNSMVGMQIVQESQKVKRHICVKNETVLVTRLDGIDVLTAKDVSLYKCYLCGKLYDDMLKIQCHLSMHFQRDLTLYRCQVCDDTFWFKFRVINHIRKNHPKQAKFAEKKYNEKLSTQKTKEEEGLSSSGGDEKGKDMEEEKDQEKIHDEVMNEGDEKVKADEMETEKNLTENKKIEIDLDGSKSSEKETDGKDVESNVKKDEKGENNTESTSEEAEENPNKNELNDILSTSNITKENTVIEISDLSNKVRKSDPFGKLYKGIRFRKKPNGSFICLLCRKSFYKEYALLQHIKIHDHPHVCYCEECGEGFMEYGQLRVHISTAHNTENEKTTSSAASKNTLLSSLLSKTAEWHKPTVKIPLTDDKHLEKAREILKQEGIQDDITVVMPSEPDDQRSTETRKANLDSIVSILSTSDTEIPDQSEIQISPKRLLMSKLLSKSKRKSTQPVKIENTASTELNDSAAVPETEREVIQVKQEPEEGTELPPPPPSTTSAAQPVINSELMAAKLNNLALLHPGLHPVVMANTLATLAAQGLPVTAQGMMLPGGKMFSGLQYPFLGIPPQTTNGIFGTLGSQVQQPVSIAQTMNQPTPSMLVDIPQENKDDPDVAVKQEPQSPIDDNNCSNHSSNTSNDPSQNLSNSETGTTDREQLYGLPQVQWTQTESDSESEFRGNPSNLPSSLQSGWGFSADGRKVTSLSRTHSRLPVVSSPVDREKICKPTVLADGRTVYRCPFCNKDFLSYSDINRHMDFHEDIRPFKCKYCEYYARTNSQLKVHKMRHQGIREFCCKLCNYKGVTQSDLNRHMKSQIHLLKAKHACPHCYEGFVTPKNLERHLDGNCIVKMQKLENGEVI